MSDEIDIATERIQYNLAVRIQMDAKDIPTGEPGECDSCGEPSPRLIEGNCVECRERMEKFRRIRGSS